MMTEATLYLFDGYNLLHAGPGSDRRELVDRLASFVALSGARGIVVFDGVGDDARYGPLEVRFAADADTALERLAVEHRKREYVILVSSDSTVVETAGREVTRLSARTFFRDLAAPDLPPRPAGGLAGKLDEETRARLERLRRGQ
jgi:predicted RNA-binding protein with PIN domain